MWQMKDDDPEKRIRELERGLADTTRTAQSPPYTGAAPPYTGGPIYLGDSPYQPGLSRRRRKATYPWLLVFVVLGILVPVVVSLVGLFVRSTPSRSTLGNGAGTTAPSSGPTVVPRGGELRVGGNMTTRTIACNDGN